MTNPQTYLHDLVMCMFSPGAWIFLVVSYVSMFILFKTYSIDKLKSLPLPPGPRPWPIVGSLFQMIRMKQLPHQYFASMATRHGPIIHLKLGSKPFVVVHSPELAMEVLRIRDAEFASRPASVFGEHFSFGYQDIIFRSSMDATWRHLRKVCATSLFTLSRLRLTAALRQEEVVAMVSALRSAVVKEESGFAVQARPLIYESNMNVISRMLFGKKYFGQGYSHGPEAEAFRTMLQKMSEESGRFHLGDYFPFLRRLDLLGTERRMREQARPAFEIFFAARLSEHKLRHQLAVGRGIGEENEDFLDVLLSLKNEDSLSDACIMALLLDLMSGGSGTGTISVEWALSELIAHPHQLAKAQLEIDTVVGRNRLVQESDLPHLPYLEAIFKETMRLHPPIPMLLPHYNPSASRLGGYKIPAGSTVIVNSWAIGRDPAIWSSPQQFNPDRFLGSTDHMQLVGGKQYQLLPFSAGRRQCPGYSLAAIHVPHKLAALIHAFDWSPPSGKRPEDISMEETMGISCFRAVPLEAVVSYRLSLNV